ncbi:MAG: DUF4145 domain-containing protein [Rhizobiaceae bacterium]|nr:DUF4145 domain-containing protein [Rhizobiaceae bacterium]
MAVVVFDCPFCEAKGMTGTPTGHFAVPKEVIESQRKSPHAFLMTNCASCWNPISVQATHKGYTTAAQHQGFHNALANALNQHSELKAAGFACELVITPSGDETAPHHLSDAVKKAFSGAERNTKMTDGEDAAAMLYRRAVDVATKEKYPSYSNLTLHQRIKKLSEDGILPKPMVDWADHIRWIGNDGAHEPEGVTKNEVKQMQGFADAFLRYLVSMPFEVDLARGKIDAQGNPVVVPPE